MTDLVSLKRSILTEKERLEKLDQIFHQKIESTLQEIKEALSYLEKAEQNFQNLENNLNDRKRDEIQLQNEKKDLLGDINSLKEQIERIKLNITEEQEKSGKFTQEMEQLDKTLNNLKTDLSSTESQIILLKENNQAKSTENENMRSRMNNQITQAQQKLDEIQREEEQEVQVSPILDFLLKEVRIDIPEVDILSTLAYRKQAIGLDELKKSVSKTPPVIILKALRNLDSKDIVKFDERLDTIEIIVNLV
ncbi:MAG: hypothetical protein ACTSPM_10925 [Candidatus Heimdallarchaeota archaeon]